MNPGFLPKTMQEAMPRLYTYDGTADMYSVPVFCKLFTEPGSGQWWITEGEDIEIDGNVVDFHMFGLCDLGMGFPELGYVSLDELISVNEGTVVNVIRDVNYIGSLGAAMDSMGISWHHIKEES